VSSVELEGAREEGEEVSRHKTDDSDGKHLSREATETRGRGAARMS
jgi:hypothetical protein